MDFISDELQNYIQDHSSPEPELLQELNRETNAKVLMPRMISGHYQGRLLSLISRMIRPRRILEIGTYTGYSALSMAEGLTEDGKLITIDINDELQPLVEKYVQRSSYKEKIVHMIGDAAELIPGITETFDLVFIDADKIRYSLYLDLVIDKLRTGGFILADNVLWSGKVIEKGKHDKDTTSILAFNEKVASDQRLDKVILPVRDGITVIIKK